MKSNCRSSSPPRSPPKNSSCWANGRLTSPSRAASPDPALQEALQVAQQFVGIAHVDALRRLDEERHRVQPEARDAERQPEADRLGDLVAHARVGHVQVGLMLVEHVLEVLLGALVVLPHAGLLAGEHGGLLLSGRLVPPDVEVAVRRRAAAARGDEPRMLVGGVVHDEVDDHPHPAVMGGADHLHEVAVIAQPRVDPVEVADVVAVVAIGRRVERHQPQARDAEIGQVVDASGETREVADAVVVAVHVGLDIQAVDDRRLPPQVAGVGDLHSALRSAGSSFRSARFRNAS